MQSRLARAAAEHALLSRAYSDLSRRLDLARFAQGEKPAATLAAGAPEPPEGLEALLDAFYARLEDRFRGSREEIAGRLRAYLPDARAAFERTGGKPALDLGCGRGEWLGVLAEAGLPAEGVDLNPQQTAEAAEAGLAIRQGDALAALAEAPDASLSLVSAHHLIEHLPFERVVSLTREALRALAPGGVLLYETPNVRNLIVGASTFHIDPTHRRPLPAEALSVLFDTVGFHPVELRHLHPSETQEAFLAERRADPAIVSLLFGPQDLAVLGTRPGAG
jgi:O-antigen chain-terminating methyltransferase